MRDAREEPHERRPLESPADGDPLLVELQRDGHRDERESRRGDESDPRDKAPRTTWMCAPSSRAMSVTFGPSPALMITNRPGKSTTAAQRAKRRSSRNHITANTPTSSAAIMATLGLGSTPACPAQLTSTPF